ncbi:type II secretion system F family protein [Candidatus Saccharibacteria bacterium]|nr:type II secretion system F family protein [Candidatus Saccharibacteria bacterium]
MSQFSYVATKKNGESAKGLVEADDRTAALEAVRKLDLHPLSVHPAHKGASFGSMTIGGKVKVKDLVIFTRQLATLVNAGVPLVRSLSTLQMQSENATLKKQLGVIVKKVEAGSSLGDALELYPKTFSAIYVNMVKAGEEGGILDEVLDRLAVQQEKDAAIRGKIKGAMTYPAVISFITFVAFFFLMTTIVPKIGDIIVSLGGTKDSLPIYTKVLLSISVILKSPSFLLALLVGLPIFIVVFKKYTSTPKGRYVWHSVLLKTPIIKTLNTKVAIARFARTFSSLMGAGVSIVQAINTTAGAIGNAVIEKELLDSAKAIQSGEQLSAQLEKSKHFPPLVSQMLAVGEETGQTDQILIKVAEFYEEEVDTFVGALSSILEPIMIVVLGSIVGVIAASVFGPISNISSNIQ